MPFETLPPLLLHTLTALHVALAGAVIFDLLHQHRSQAVTIAWLLVLALLPYVGIVLYFFAGAPRKRGARLGPLLQASMQGAPLRAASDRHPTESLLCALGIPPASLGNRLTISIDNEHAAQQLSSVIASARQRLLLSVFSLESDLCGERVTRQLLERAAQGIDVRVLIDGYGSKEMSRATLRRLRGANIHIHRFRPLWRSAAGRGALNYRNHRKMLVADAHTVWFGGRNLADKYLTRLPDDSQWTDLSFTLTGPAVREFACVGAVDWTETTAGVLDLPTPGATAELADGPSCVQVLPSGPDLEDDTLHAALLAAVMNARTRFWIASPFFVPDDALQAALRLACRRQVDVRIIVPRRSNQLLADWVRDSYLRDLAQAGARIYLHRPGMLHAKAVVADDSLAIVGSANFDMRSHFTNHEICAALFSSIDIETVAQCLDAWSRSAIVYRPETGAARRVLAGALRIAAPLF